ncbi:hypothetical protein V502_10113 [Pseudogymnoascus sp. VKM F-4520 (FW-2644)]|nr:hypothetical protein V502_10113 [Pseudogymnoascus sp. VKM F-4520 (FW-2644)]
MAQSARVAQLANTDLAHASHLYTYEAHAFYAPPTQTPASKGNRSPDSGQRYNTASTDNSINWQRQHQTTAGINRQQENQTTTASSTTTNNNNIPTSPPSPLILLSQMFAFAVLGIAA